MLPDEETHVTVGGISIMLSDAVGSIHETESSGVVMFGGHDDIVGGMSSAKTILFVNGVMTNVQEKEMCLLSTLTLVRRSYLRNTNEER